VSIESEKITIIRAIFADEFEAKYSTILVGGGSEPLYLPKASHNVPAKIIYRADYLSSALHEIAHWCIAGEKRLNMQDYGYWYAPDGRSAEQQELFEQSEVKPQALEWMFSVACGQVFRLSTDNLSGNVESPSSGLFSVAVADQAQQWCANDQLPSRGLQFLNALCKYFGLNGKCHSHYQSTCTA
jgi:elongation factor P hydroxylase